ncbi:MAG TPA: HlyD family efflux transporter periplasmic adaptor subunit [Caproiciproducens sp.]|nr:HlyD family efflux transporter periplasmic adaptor subunit [Caproiciproducens sp.]
MKKYVMLAAFTLITVLGIIIFGIISRNSVVTVSTVQLHSISVENSVSCSGRIERISTTNVYAPATGMVKDVSVKLGDTVQAGQTLFTIQTYTASADSSDAIVSDLPSSIPDSYRSLLSLYGSQLSSAQSQNTEIQKVTAPVAGEITSIPVSDQSYLTIGSTAAVIADISGLQVRLSVNESQISDIKVGQKAVITGVGFKNSSYTGRVKSISSDAKQVVTATGQETVVEVLVGVDNAGSDIKPGYTAKVKIITSKDTGVLVAPYEAVRADKNGNEYVFKVRGNTAVKTPIVTRQEFDSGFEVTSGLANRDVIIENPDNLSNGTRVIPSGKGEVSSVG